ncbi:MAG: Hsp33 family molecular chaperone HslO [Myxococcales bacterium]|jgi:molecular chaperone Hsp33|nr:Hsp33 family molecular chaperone HslO [Myxococcales bacterium]
MSDTNRIVHALAFDDQVRMIACTSTGIVAEAARVHDTSPVATTALGRLLTGALLLGATHKNATRLTLQLQGKGPAGLLLARAGADGSVYGTISNPQVEVPLRDDGKLDVGGAVGRSGILQVVRDLGFGEPYVGATALVSGEIGDDLAQYLYDSEQIASAFGVGVNVTSQGVTGAGGFLVQILGGLDEHAVWEVEHRLRSITHLSQDIEDGMTAYDLLWRLAGDHRVLEEREPRYFCPHDRDYYRRRIAELGRATVQELFLDRDTIEVTCEFTRQTWTFDRADVGLTGSPLN